MPEKFYAAILHNGEKLLLSSISFPAEFSVIADAGFLLCLVFLLLLGDICCNLLCCCFGINNSYPKMSPVSTTPAQIF